MVCYGIAGGIKKDVKLGDICVSQRVLELSEQSKIEDNKEGLEISLSPRVIETNRTLCTLFAFLTQNPEFRQLKGHWEDAHIETILEFEDKHPIQYDTVRDRMRGTGKVFFGPIVSYAVVASDNFVEKIRSINRNILAIETESAGVFEAAVRADVPSITVRGISDFSDSNKAELEQESEEFVRSLAASNAAKYIWYQLKNPSVVSFIREQKVDNEVAKEGDLFGRNAKEPMENFLAEVGDEIDFQLKEKCSAYMHKKKDSFLPTPRLVRLDPPSQPSDSRDWEKPTELSEVIEENQRVAISLESTYPDRGLPWMIADNILRTNGERLYIPIVVDGDQVSPNRFKLGKLERMKQIAGLNNDGVVPVIVVDEPHLHSETRMRALIDEANKEPTAKFVLITKKFSALLDTNNFLEKFESERFGIANFSLVELSDFLAMNFEFQALQAAVLATQLNQTFEQFDMRAHPAFFAGISSEMLTRLIKANRRGELIQLAVDAALMITVELEGPGIDLSKSWRKEYLRELVVRQYVNGEVIDESRALDLAKEMARKRDIEIDALEFVQTFVAAGVLHFLESGMEFITVFVRDYLIAEYLHHNPKAAIAYFNFYRIDPDFNVLDILAELGASKEIVKAVIDLIDQDLEYLSCKKASSIDKFMERGTRFSTIGDFSQFTDQKEAVTRAIRYVGENETDLKRKQNILDLHKSVAERTQRAAAEEGNLKTSQLAIDNSVAESGSEKMDAQDCGDGRKDDDFSIDRIAVHWCAGCLVLTTGAEKLEASLKRQLAKGVITLGCRIAEEVLQSVEGIDFLEIRDAILEDEEFVKLEEELDVEERKKLKRDLDKIVGIVEFSVLSGAYRAVLAALCSKGSGNLLRLTIANVDFDRSFEKITKAVWASDLDPDSASSLMDGVLKDLEESHILRFVLALHFINRVYWAKWKKSDRESFLEVAAKIMEGLDTKIDKGKVKRMIKQEND